MLNTNNCKPKYIIIHIGLTAKWKSGKPEELESGEIEAWEWFDRKHIPNSLSIGASVTLQALEERIRRYDLNN